MKIKPAPRQPMLFVLLAVVPLLGAVAETAPVPAGSAVAVYGPGDAAANAAAAVAEKAWTRVPKILARIVPPKFPDRDFLVTEFGAAGDGVTDCTAAIREAISRCNRSGGGRVVVPSGTFLTGPIHLSAWRCASRPTPPAVVTLRTSTCGTAPSSPRSLAST